MITALAIMIAIAGYLQFAGTGLEEEYQKVDDDNVYTGNTSSVNSGGVITENYTADGLLDLSDEDLLNGLQDIDSLDTDVNIIVDDYLDGEMEVADTSGTPEGQMGSLTPDDGEIPGEAVFTSTTGIAILSDAKLLKEQTRAKNKETLLEIIGSAGLSDEQKQEAVNSMVRMTEIAEKEAAAEILLEAKGFKDAVVSVNGDAVDVVVNAAELDDAMRAQIEDIVSRKTEIAPENIIISTVVQ
jgi:stage III sporulation protein AH